MVYPAERFRGRVTGHEFAMACVQSPLPLEVWSQIRGHLLSKSDLWTPCVVDIAIRSVPKPCYPDLAEESLDANALTYPRFEEVYILIL